VCVLFPSALNACIRQLLNEVTKKIKTETEAEQAEKRKRVLQAAGLEDPCESPHKKPKAKAKGKAKAKTKK
jgi:Na+-translocating ferredoxin:NAD+ oxidoreductase RnfG subunit